MNDGINSTKASQTDKSGLYPHHLILHIIKIIASATEYMHSFILGVTMAPMDLSGVP